MSLEQEIKELNATMKKVISIFEVYPNPLDEKVVDPKKVEASKEKAEASPIVDNVEVDTEFKPEHTIDEIAALTKEAIRANKAENHPKIKAKMDELGIPKVTATPPEHIDTMHDFLKAMV